MPTEWLRVMLDEVARKRREADAARVEARVRDAGRAADPAPVPAPRQPVR
jgi:hypothetical protein